MNPIEKLLLFYILEADPKSSILKNSGSVTSVTFRRNELLVLGIEFCLYSIYRSKCNIFSTKGNVTGPKN